MGSGKNSRSSKSLELRVSGEDAAALRSAREQRRLSPEEYARLLAQLPVSVERLRRRNPTRGERFRL